MFLTDLPHSVNPVKEGTRVTLQYDLLLEDDVAETKEDEIECDKFGSKSVYEKSPAGILTRTHNLTTDKEQLIPMIDSFLKEHPNDSVAFLLTQLYPLTVSLDNLKAGDQTLYELLSKHYSVELGVAVNAVPYDHYDYIDPCVAENLHVLDYQSKQKLMSDVLKGKQPKKGTKGNVHVFFGDAAKFLTMSEKIAVEHTGNESAMGEFIYTSFVLAVGPKKKQ